MSRVIIVPAFIAWTALVTASGSTQSTTGGIPPARPPVPPVARIGVPEVYRATVSSGLRLVVVEDPRAPIFEARLIVLTGWLDEPAAAPGVSRLAISAGSLAPVFDSLGLEYAAGLTPADEAGLASTLRVSGLSPVWPEALSLLIGVVRRSAPAPEDLAAQRTETTRQMRQRRSDPRATAVMRALSLHLDAEQAQHAYPSDTAVDQRTAADLARFYGEHYRPGNALLLVVGPIGADSVRRQVERSVAEWADGLAGPFRRPRALGPSTKAFEGVIRPGARQTMVAFSAVVGGRSGADHAALYLLRWWVMEHVRERLRADSISAMADAVIGWLGEAPVLTIRVTVAPEFAGRSVEVVRSEIARLASTQPDPGQFDAHRRLSVARHLIATESQTSVAELVTMSELLVSGSFWSEFQTALVDLTGADIQRVARDYLRPAAFTIAAVGDSAGVKRAATVASPH